MDDDEPFVPEWAWVAAMIVAAVVLTMWIVGGSLYD